jgi:hypothetical protein
MSSKGIGKRFGFKRSNTNQEEPITVNEISRLDSQTKNAGESSKLGPDHGIPEEVLVGDVRDITEVEANQRLKNFKRDHMWDPNMVRTELSASRNKHANQSIAR